MRDTGRLAKEYSSPENKESYIFIVKKKVGRVLSDHLLPHFWVDIRLTSLVPPLNLYGSPNWDCHGAI